MCHWSRNNPQNKPKNLFPYQIWCKRAAAVTNTSHLIGHHVEEVVVHATAVHPLSGRHRASNLLLLGYHHSTFGHKLPAQTGLAKDGKFTSSKWPQPNFRQLLCSEKWVGRKSKSSKSCRLSLLCPPYDGLTVNLVRRIWLQPRPSAWEPLRLLSVHPHWGTGCFVAHILRALALWLWWVLPEKRERWWWMPSVLPHPPPVLPAQIRQRVGEGRREGWEEGGRQGPCVSPICPYFPFPQLVQILQWDWASQTVIQIWKIKQLLGVLDL